jgi:hypothetical protein
MGIARFWRTWVYCFTFLDICNWPWILSSWIRLHVIFQYLNNNIIENSCLLDCDGLSSDVWFLIFKRIIASFCSGSSNLGLWWWRQYSAFRSQKLHTSETASRHRWLGSSATQLWEPHISQEYSNVKLEHLPLCTCYSPNKCPCWAWLPVDMCKVSYFGLK